MNASGSAMALIAIGGVMLTLGAGCREEKAPAPTVASAAPAPEPQGFRIDQKSVDVGPIRAIGFAGESSLRLAVATQPLSCADLKNALLDSTLALPGIGVDIWVAPQLNGDEKNRWGFHAAYVSSDGERKPGVTRAVLLDDVEVTADQVNVTGLDIRLAHEVGLIALDGPINAARCPPVTRPEPARPQSELKLSLADISVDVGGATLRKRDGKWFLRLSRAPHDCSTRLFEGFDVVVDLAFDGGLEAPRSPTFVALQGAALIGTPAGSKTGALTATFANPPDAASEVGAGGGSDGETSVKVEGTVTVEGDVQVKLSGAVQPLVCDPWSEASAL